MSSGILPFRHLASAKYRSLPRRCAAAAHDSREQIRIGATRERRVSFPYPARHPLGEDGKRWRSASGTRWKRELQPIGKLVLANMTRLRSGLRTEWLETDAKPMETP